MLNKVEGTQDLHIVNMLIRALSDEIAQQQTSNTVKSAPDFPTEIEEALFELRLRKLLICAMSDASDGAATTSRVERRRTKRVVM